MTRNICDGLSRVGGRNFNRFIIILSFVCMFLASSGMADEMPMSESAWRSEWKVRRRNEKVAERDLVNARRQVERTGRLVEAGRASDQDLRETQAIQRKAEVDYAVAEARQHWAKTGWELAEMGENPADEIAASRLLVNLWEWRLKEAKLLRDYAAGMADRAERDVIAARQLNQAGRLSDEALSVTEGRLQAATRSLEDADAEVERISAIVRNGGRPVPVDTTPAPPTAEEIGDLARIKTMSKKFGELKEQLEEARRQSEAAKKKFAESKMLHDKGLLSDSKYKRAEAENTAATETRDRLEEEYAKAAEELTRARNNLQEK